MGAGAGAAAAGAAAPGVSCPQEHQRQCHLHPGPAPPSLEFNGTLAPTKGVGETVAAGTEATSSRLGAGGPDAAERDV